MPARRVLTIRGSLGSAGHAEHEFVALEELRSLLLRERLTRCTVSTGVAVSSQLHYDAVNDARECKWRRISVADRRTTVATAVKPAGRSVDRPGLRDLHRAH